MKIIDKIKAKRFNPNKNVLNIPTTPAIINKDHIINESFSVALECIASILEYALFIDLALILHFSLSLHLTIVSVVSKHSRHSALPQAIQIPNASLS